jgi:hypothetical protein
MMATLEADELSANAALKLSSGTMFFTIAWVAGQQGQRQERRELRQPDQAEVEQLAGGLIHLPADRHALHLDGQRAEHARRQIMRK